MANIKSLQAIYNEIVKLLQNNNVELNITPPRPYLARIENEEEVERLYFDQAWKYKKFDWEND